MKIMALKGNIISHCSLFLAAGNSMGGAVVSEAASSGMIPNLIGVAVLDIVEGKLMEYCFSIFYLVH